MIPRTSSDIARLDRSADFDTIRALANTTAGKLSERAMHRHGATVLTHASRNSPPE
jgi:hypothetical protein